MSRQLLIGCGASRERRLWIEGRHDWVDLVTLDRYPESGADVLHDLEDLPLPFPDDSFDEIHAYEVLEHVGRQGDAVGFFALFSELWRILEPGGYLAATCPSYRSMWAWGDPSHTRVITSGTLVFLDQTEYAKQIGKTAMSDFRHLYRADFAPVWGKETDVTFRFVLCAVKPARLDKTPG